MPKPVCVECQIEYRPERNDVVLEEMASFGSYRLWCCDLWKCPGCGHELITGYGKEAYGEHWQPGYLDKLENAKRYGLYRCYEYREGEEVSDSDEHMAYRNVVKHGGQPV